MPDDLTLQGNLALLLLAALPLMGSPGPATMSLAGVGASMGAASGRPYLAGIVVGTSTVLVLIATGITALLLSFPALVTGLTAAAALYILYLAYRIATAPVLTGNRASMRAPSFWSGVLLALANPKAYAAIGAVYSSRTLVPDSLILDAAAKISVLTLVIVVVNSTWLLFGATFSLFLRSPRTGRIANLTFAGLLVLSVAWAFYSG